MANIDLYKQKLVNIAAAIREKLNESSKYTLEQMPGKIRSIDTGGGGIQIVTGTNKGYVPKDTSKVIVNTFTNISIATGHSTANVTKV